MVAQVPQSGDGDGRVLVADAGADWAEPTRTLAVALLREARANHERTVVTSSDL